MKVYTKTGDKGTTSLVGGKRVPKNHPRVEAYGDLDELISFLGIVICDANAEREEGILRKIQENLMLVSAHFASDGSAKKMKNITDEDIAFLESEIDEMTGEMPPQTAFILPGDPRVASECHVARTICRRAERHALAILDECGCGTINEHDSAKKECSTAETENIAADKKEICQVEMGIKYLNRLSDYLFTLGRFFCHKNGVDETFWLP